MLDLDKITRVHMSLFGEPPKEDHLVLYRAFPKAHGWFTPDGPANFKQFEAVTVLGLALTYPFEGNCMHQTLFLVTASLEDWAVSVLEAIAKRIFARIREDANLKAAKFMRRAFENLPLGSRAFAFETEPERWVAFGFQENDPLPDWLRNGLLAV